MVRLLAFLVLALPLSAAYKKVAGGYAHFLVLRDDGAVFGFGEASRGEIAVEGRELVRTPLRIPLPAPAKDIAAAFHSSYALLEDGTVWSWGADENGMLGRAGPVEPGKRRRPQPIPAAIPGLSQVVAIYGNGYSAAALTAAGEVWSWGWLFHNETTFAPERVDGLPPIATLSIGPGRNPGRFHTLAVGRDGSLWAWGNNSSGELGNGTLTPSPKPVRVSLPPVVSAAAGGNNSVAILADGTVRAWGNNDSSTMGNGKNVQGETASTPTPVPGVAGAVSVAAGNGHIFALLKNGTLRAWGHDGWGQCGLGNAGDYQMSPATTKLTAVKAVFAVGNRSFAITQDGRLWFFGPGFSQLPGIMSGNVHAPAELVLKTD
ncbi:MAG: hypothetical protein HY821_22735 [Acidobacteria bacterium]|nr:hypothetical protein [Acidobacteriota bacterium]